MKLWQLASVARENFGLLEIAASEKKEWKRYHDLYQIYDDLVSSQDRSKLDLIIADEFVQSVLKKIDGNCYLGKDGRLRSWKMNPDDQILSFLDVFLKYGGDVLEDVLEHGVCTLHLLKIMRFSVGGCIYDGFL